MNTKEQVINQLIETNGYESYLEIGYRDGGSFHKINCFEKYAVDPEPLNSVEGLFVLTSDAFFKQNDKKFDLIFLDGLHESKQVRKDLVNASKFLSQKGAIVMHDLIPKNELMQRVPREVREWTGDCWRTWVGFRKKYPDMESLCFDFDYGVGVIFPDGKKIIGNFNEKDLSFEDYLLDIHDLANIKDGF